MWVALIVLLFPEVVSEKNHVRWRRIIEMTAEERYRCHRPTNRRSRRDCLAYVRELEDENALKQAPWPSVPDACWNITWTQVNNATGNKTKLGTINDWGSCVNSTNDGTYRYFVSNAVPAHFFPPYCPISIGSGYCVGSEACVFDGLICGDEATVGSSAGYTPYGDVWIPVVTYMSMPMNPNPTRSDRPGSMYDAIAHGVKNIGAATGITIEDGITIQGPNDAGDYNIDEAGFVLPCGGHVTPPTDVLDLNDDTIGNDPSGPYFHYHQAATCLDAFVSADKPVADGGNAQTSHGNLFAYALDGFGIYTFSDLNGAAPILDECGGHFGPTDDYDLSTVSYHYHATPYTPYHLACQGPALSNCAATQPGANYCGQGCGADICIQPGSHLPAVQSYIASFNSTWFDAYTNNYQNSSSTYLNNAANHQHDSDHLFSDFSFYSHRSRPPRKQAQQQ
uniref:YHYH domain-containing protein n=1 Tax=Aureoumbra lagunensis TaxID=44058 RepID=A0A7S3JR69_9STRA|mmetsp:Transcript_23762/g.30919  ORF Transcript_23762/g.30919 Transcript_23762/m.30919 type:complete len:451 (+) Transcript_23762:72-1424(+)